MYGKRNARRCMPWLVPLLSAGMFYVGAKAHGQSAFSLEELVAQTRVTESRIHSLAVTMNGSNITRRQTRYGPTEANGKFRETWHVDIGGIGWAAGHGTVSQRNADGIKTVGEEKFSATFDGTVGNRIMRLAVEGEEDTVLASIEEQLRGRMDSPWHFVERVSALIEAGDTNISGSQTWDGREVIVLQKMRTDTEKASRKTEIWIDPELQFTVVRRRQLKRAEQSGNWEVEWTRDSHDHHKLADRVWLPKRASFKIYASPGTTNIESEYVFTDWRINEEIDQGRLGLEFPEGIRVRNSK